MADGDIFDSGRLRLIRGDTIWKYEEMELLEFGYRIYTSSMKQQLMTPLGVFETVGDGDPDPWAGQPPGWLRGCGILDERG